MPFIVCNYSFGKFYNVQRYDDFYSASLGVTSIFNLSPQTNKNSLYSSISPPIVSHYADGKYSSM